MSFSEDDESKTKPQPEEKQDKEPFGINGKDMKDFMVLGAIVVIAVLFKDEIMNALGGLGSPAQTAAPAPTESEEPAAGEEAGAKGGKKGGKRGGKRGGRRGGRRHKRGGGRGGGGGEQEAESNYYGMSYFGIANA